jgi:hypothetical protein
MYKSPRRMFSQSPVNPLEPCNTKIPYPSLSVMYRYFFTFLSTIDVLDKGLISEVFNEFFQDDFVKFCDL